MASLQILTGEKKGQIVDLKGEQLGIGRSLDNDLCSENDSRLSRHHAVLQRRGELWTLQDLGSSNGTFIERGGRPLRVAKVTPLVDGDIIVAGSMRLSMTVDAAAAPTYVGSMPDMPVFPPSQQAPPWQPPTGPVGSQAPPWQPPAGVPPPPGPPAGANAGYAPADFERTEAFLPAGPVYPQRDPQGTAESLVTAAPPPFQPARVHRAHREGHRLLATLIFMLPALISALVALYFTALRSEIHVHISNIHLP